MMAGGRGRRAGRTVLAWLAIGAPFIALAWATPWLRDESPLTGIEAITLDWRYQLRGPRRPGVPVTLVTIDDATLRAVRNWPVPRGVLGRAVAQLNAAGARVIVLDLLMSEPGRTPAADQALAASLRRAGRVLLGTAFTFGRANTAATEEVRAHAVPVMRRPGTAPLPEADGLVQPIPALAHAAAGIGNVNVVLGPGGALRQIYPAIALNGVALPALPVVAVAHYRGLGRSAIAMGLPDGVGIGDEHVPVGPDGRWTINYYGPRHTFETISLRDVLDGRMTPDEVRGRIVWIGASATGIGDSFVTPYDPALPGAEAFATVTANLMDGSLLVQNAWTGFADMLAVVVIGLATVWLARLQPAWRAIAFAAVPLAVWAVVTSWTFIAWDVWLNVTVPALASIAAKGVMAGWRLLLSEGQRGRLAAYLPEPLVEPLSRGAPGLVGRRQEAAVLFVDLAGFTRESEAGTTEDTVALLRELHAAFEDQAAAHGGYVDQFIGDGAMLVFGVPTSASDDAGRALACARALLADAEARGRRVRIGLHSGEVELARLGGRRQHQFTLAGDTVNVASRLMEIARGHGAALAVSGPVVAAARATGGASVAEGLTLRQAEPVRGRRGRIDIWIGGDVSRP